MAEARFKTQLGVSNRTVVQIAIEMVSLPVWSIRQHGSLLLE
jgi:hypothetical protein